MGHLLTPYSWPSIFSCAVLSVASLLAWRRRPARGARSLTVLFVIALIWAAGQVIELNSPSLSGKFAALKFEFIGVVLVSPMAVTFALAYAGFALTRRRVSAIWCTQPITLVIALLNPLEGGLMWQRIGLTARGPFLALDLAYGPAFWWLVYSSKLLALIGGLIVVRALIRAPRLYRRQITLILVALAIPVLYNLTFVFGLAPVPNLDLTPFTLGISALIYISALYGFQMLDLVPVVRSKLIESMREGILVVDTQGRCIDSNTALRELLNLPADITGVNYTELIPTPLELSLVGTRSQTGHTEFLIGDQVIAIEIQPLFSRDALDGWLLTLRNVTSWHELERENIRLVEQSSRRAAEAEMLRAASATVAASLSQQETIERIFDALGQIIPYDSASVLLLRDDALEIVGGSGFAAPERVIGLRFPVNEDTPAGIVYHTNRSCLLSDARSAHPIFRQPPHDVIRSWIGVPLLVQEQMIGMVTLDSRRLHNFTADDTRLVEAFADQIAIALEHARLFEHVQRLAAIDSLTEAFNRRHFFELGRHEIERTRRYGHDVAAVMVDIDHFKRINDTYGHQAGDQVIQVVAHIALANLRTSDILARYGGEEFIILLPETDLNGALLLAERLRREIETLEILVDGCVIRITASLGVAVLLSAADASADIGESLEALVDRADQELYIAKQCGRNRVSAQPLSPQLSQR